MSAIKKFLPLAVVRKAVERSKRAARAFHLQTSDRGQRYQSWVALCRQRGLKHPDKAARLGEYITYNLTTTRSDYGTFDTDRTIAGQLDWTVDAVRYERKRLSDAGLLATFLGKPVRGRGKPPVLHYRLAKRACELLRAFARVVRKSPESKDPVKVPNLKSSTQPATKAFANAVDKPPERRDRSIGASALLGMMGLIGAVK